MQSLYETLEVSPRASHCVIRAAYRCLVQQHHPDKNPQREDAGQRLSCINRAYAVLSDPQSRHAYDVSQGLPGTVEERRGRPSSRPFGFRPLVWPGG